MTSVHAVTKQTTGHWICLSSLSSRLPDVAQIYGYTGGSGSGATFVPGSFSTATWASFENVPSVAPQTLLRDLGMTVVSANRTFRKVAPVRPGATANAYAGDTSVSFGVSTLADGSAMVGWIELGYEGFGNAARVARYDNLTQQ